MPGESTLSHRHIVEYNISLIITIIIVIINIIIIIIVFLGLTYCVLFYNNKTITRMLVTIGIRFKQHLDTRYFAFCNLSAPGMFLSLDLLSEYLIHHSTIGLLYVTSIYSTRIFCRGVSGFATDCACRVWCRVLTSCLLFVGPLFWKSTFKQLLGSTFDIVDCKSSLFSWYFDVYNCICLNTSSFFWLYLYISNCVLFYQELMYKHFP